MEKMSSNSTIDNNPEIAILGPDSNEAIQSWLIQINTVLHMVND